MTDLDQFLLKEIAHCGLVYKDEGGIEHCVVPRDLLLRVTSVFDVEHVRTELRGPRYRQ